MNKIHTFFRTPARNRFLADVFYILFSLLLIWAITSELLGKGFMILGHDSGLALDSRAFLETRLYAWDERINFGEDNSLMFGSLTIHALDYLSSLIAGVLYAGNQVNLFFWLSLIFISAFIFSSRLRGILGDTFAYIFPFLITFNFYIFQSIFIMERAKYSLVAATLLFLAILVRFFNKQISVVLAAVLTSILFSILNGGSWLGLPLFGGLLLIVMVIIAFLVVSDFASKNFRSSIRFITLLITSAILFILINSYSLFPYLQTFFKKDYLIFQNLQTQDSNKAWLDYISQGSSFTNIFRMQGVPDWYETKFTAAPMHPFSGFYIENPLMIMIGFLIPITAFASILLVKNSSQKKIIAISSVTSLIAMIFMSASRSPWGFIYEFLYNNVPGFLIFRSSFYKFGYAFIISYSVLLTFTVSSLITILNGRFGIKHRKSLVSFVLVVLIIFGWMFYHQKLLSKDIFKWRDGFSTQVKIPSYVNEYRDYVKGNDITEGRVLLLPKFHKVWLSDGYDWGYWSLSTIHYSLTKEPVISNSSGLNAQERYWVDLLYRSIERQEADKVQAIAGRLGITRILLKMDAIPPDGWSAAENPVEVKKVIDSFNFLSEEKTFGEWIVYSINSSKPQLFTTNNRLVELTKDDITGAYPFIENEKAVFNGPDDVSGFITSRIDHHECKSCILEQSLDPQQFIWSRLLPNSLIFPVRIAFENYKLSKISDPKLRLDYYYNLTLKRSAEVSAMFFFQTHDAYIIGNLKTIQGYLEQINRLTRETANPESFSDAKLMMENIESVESLLVNKLSSTRSLSGVLKEEVSKTIWEINALKKYHSSILENPDRWSNEKVFGFEVTQLPYQLYIDDTTLPLLPNGERVLPGMFLNDKAISLDSSLDRQENWLPINSESLKIGNNKLVLRFDYPKNVLKINDQVRIDTPEGKRKCYKGTVDPKPQNGTYLLKVKTEDELRFFARIDADEEIPKYLEWNKSVVIDGSFKDEYFKHMYTVPSLESDFSFYICGDNENLPVYSEFIIEELFAPELIGIKSLQINSVTNPNLTYKRINPAKFELQIDGSASPYLLVMNQRYSPLWEIRERGTGKEINTKPFQVDLYATGWIIDSTQRQDLVIEFAPQKYFYRGVIVSGLTLFGIAVMVIYLARRKRE